VTVHALGPSRSGGFQAWRAGMSRPRTTTVLQFAAGRSASNVVVVPVSSGGRIALHNTAKGRTGLAVDVDGYVPATTLTPPTASNGRYLSDLTGELTTDTATMGDHGCADAQAGSRFVLLDLGAQTVTPPLGPGNAGVALAKTNPTVRYAYADLQELIGAYLVSFAQCSGGRTAEVAVGTSNSGAWDPAGANYYAPADRGKDWAGFVQALADAAPKGITVAGAGDFEPGFAGTEAQVETWKQNYLVTTTTEFIFNGSADGCPVTWTRNGTCSRGWTAGQLYRLASGSRTRALPQIYFGAMATQWAMIDATGGGGIRFVGALQQPTVSDSLSAAQSWVALSRAVSAVSTTAVPREVVTLLG
jgi:hypothetical protein